MAASPTRNGKNGNGHGGHRTHGDGVATTVLGVELAAVREALAELHRRLVDASRLAYEREHGRIAGPGELLQLLTQHDHFAWLRQLSELLADLDALSAETPTADLAAAVRGAAESLVQPGQDPSRFWSRYSPLLQEHPDVAVAHGQLRQLLGHLPGPREGGAQELRARHQQALAKKRR